MRKWEWILWPGLLMLVGCQDQQPGISARRDAPREVPTYDARTFYETTSLSGASFSPDESRILLSSDQTGIFNVYAVPIDGRRPRRLTESADHAEFAIRFFPFDNRFLYTSDQGGNELDHLYVRETDGMTRDLTPGDKLKAGFIGFAGDYETFFVTTNERNPQMFDLYAYRTDGYERELVFQNDEAFEIADVSRDGRWVALVKVRTTADTDLYLWDRANPDQAPQHITPHNGDVAHTVFTFTPDSRQLVYGTDEHGEFVQAWTYELGSRAKRPLIVDDWDVMYVTYSETGRYRVHATNDDARTNVVVWDTHRDRAVKLPQLPAGDVRNVRIAPSETRMAMYVSSDTQPANLYVWDMNAGDQAVQLTDTLNPAIDPANLVASSVVRYESFDGLKIPSILYRPHQAGPRSRVPALVWVHGGPGGQSRQGYSAMIQHLVNHGYAVLAVNNRGSSGYGKTFFHLDDRKHGEVDLQDCVYARHYLARQDWVDPEKIAIIGGSYGGFMVVAALAFTPDVFDAGVDIFGVTNWLRTLQSIPPWWASFREALYAEMGDPAEDADRLERISPLFHAENIKRPLLVIQGANDPRVLQTESDEMVAAVRKSNVPVDYVLFPDEGHGFLKRENRITASEKIVAFLDQYLKGVGPSMSAETLDDESDGMSDTDAAAPAETDDPMDQ